MQACSWWMRTVPETGPLLVWLLSFWELSQQPPLPEVLLPLLAPLPLPPPGRLVSLLPLLLSTTVLPLLLVEAVASLESLPLQSDVCKPLRLAIARTRVGT